MITLGKSHTHGHVERLVFGAQVPQLIAIGDVE
jgi:hypothetical protein